MPTALDLLSTVGPIAGGVVNTLGSRGAAGALRAGNQQAAGVVTSYGDQLMQLYKQMLANQQAKLQPYEDVGLQNLNTYNDKANAPVTPFSFTGADLANEPGYQFGLDQGQKSLVAQGNAHGNRFTPATSEALDRYATDYASTKYNDAYQRSLQTYNTNYKANQDQLNRLLGLADIGQQETNVDVGAQGTEGALGGQALLNTSNQLSNLQQSTGEANAAGTLGTSNAITGTLQQLLQNSQGQQLLKALGLGGPAGGAVNVNGMTPQQMGNLYDTPAPAVSNVPLGPPGEAAGIAGEGSDVVENLPGSIGTIASNGGELAGIGGAGAAAAGAGIGAAGAGGSLAGVAAGAVPEIPLAATGAATAGAGEAGLAALPGAEAAGVGGGGGLFGSVAGFMTNPWTIGIGAGILAAGAIIKAMQVHPVADEWVQGSQNKFDKAAGQAFQGFTSAMQSGKLSQDQALQAYQQMQQMYSGYENSLQQFGAKGSKQKTVANQAQKTFNEQYGPGGHKILDAMAGYINNAFGADAWRQATGAA